MRIKDKKAVERYKKKLDLARSVGVRNPFETKEETKAAIERAKKDFAYCVQRYFPHYADAATPYFHIDFANMVAKNQTFKGFCVFGRAMAKSVLNDILLPFWLWIRGEPVYEVIIGNNADRAAQLLEDLRAEFEANPQIINDYGIQHNPGSWEEGFFVTKGGFIGQALGMGQSVRGLRVKNKRPTHIVPDDTETKDLLKNPKRMNEMVRWIERDLIPTMDGDIRRYIHVNNRSAAIMMMTILRDRHPNWKWYQVNAYDPVTYEPAWKEKYSATYYKEVEDDIGQLAAYAEYNNKPHIEGEIFKEEQIQYAPMPKLNQFKIIIGRWDVAYAGTATADYNSIVVQGVKDKDFWVIDSYCKQSKMRQAVEWMANFQMNLPKTVVVHWKFEAQFWNDEVERTIREVEAEFGIILNIIKVQAPRVHKYDRILKLQPYYQNGRIYYNEKLKAHQDTQVGIAQLLGIEPGYKTHDDFPDAHQGGIEDLEPYITYDYGRSNEILQGRMQPNHERI